MRRLSLPALQLVASWTSEAVGPTSTGRIKTAGFLKIATHCPPIRLIISFARFPACRRARTDPRCPGVFSTRGKRCAGKRQEQVKKATRSARIQHLRRLLGKRSLARLSRTLSGIKPAKKLRGLRGDADRSRTRPEKTNHNRAASTRRNAHFRLSYSLQSRQIGEKEKPRADGLDARACLSNLQEDNHLQQRKDL